MTATKIRKEFALCIYLFFFIKNIYAAIHGITFLIKAKNMLLLKLSPDSTHFCPIFPFYAP